MTVLEKAYTFAKEKHEGQFRRDGVTPYFTHCEKVASLVDTDLEKAVAYCHDLLEDGRATQQEIADEVDSIVALYVVKLSHKKDINYFEYIKHIQSTNDNIKKIKIADIVANLSDNPTQKQIEKYNKALRILANV